MQNLKKITLALAGLILGIEGTCLGSDFTIQGNYVRTVCGPSNIVAMVYSNTFKVILSGTGYEIDTYNPDFGSGTSIPCRVQGDRNENVSLATSVLINNPGPHIQAPDLSHLKDEDLEDDADQDSGSFPIHGKMVLKALWFEFFAAEMNGSNWDASLTGGPLPRLIENDLLPTNTISEITNTVDGNSFLIGANLFCGPTMNLPDGTIGHMLAPYDAGYLCVTYKVGDWMQTPFGMFPRHATFRQLTTKGDAKDKNDVNLYTEFDFNTVSVGPGPDRLDRIKSRQAVTQVSDWRLMEFQSLGYTATNNNWRSMEYYTSKPQYGDFLVKKAEMQKALLNERSHKKPLFGSISLPVRLAVLSFFILNFAVLGWWYAASRKRNQK